jgi:STAS-like domain of unknown function (DUF4325)
VCVFLTLSPFLTLPPSPISHCCIVSAEIDVHIELELNIVNGSPRLTMNRLMLPPTQNESTITICVTDVLGDNLCIACEDGKRVYEHVAIALKAGQKVYLSFRDGEDITSAFLAEAFSRLYTNFSEELIERKLSFTDINPDDAADIECVIQDVKDYLNNPQQFKNAIIEAMGEDAV